MPANGENGKARSRPPQADDYGYDKDHYYPADFNPLIGPSRSSVSVRRRPVHEQPLNAARAGP